MNQPASQQNDLQSDSLTTGIAFMMALTIAQRGVGFVRTAIFCRLLPENELGQWSLVLSFVMLFAPLSMMGITGSFGRYVEHYFQRGLVKRFFKRTAVVVMLLASTVLLGIWVRQEWVAWCVFGSEQQRSLIVPACFTLATTIVYNYFLETMIALRYIRVGSVMELISSWTFALLGICMLAYTDLGSYGVILSFALGNLLASLFACAVLSSVWNKLPQSDSPFPHLSLWQKLAPFAIGLWLINIVTNLFDMVDRYMIVHFSRIPATDAQAMVGQYFSSLALPMLMVGVSSTLAHLVVPYLTEDWEAGRYRDVSKRVNLAMKMLGFVLCFGSVAIVLVAPLIFRFVYGGKYDAGLAVLPWTITFCHLKGVSSMAYNYLFCVERTKLTFASVLVGLLANIILNALLLPRFGLLGAALATTIGCLAVNLAIVLWFSVGLGFALDRRVLGVLAFPLVLCLGAYPSAVAIILLSWTSVRTSLVFSIEERNQIDQIIQGFIRKVLPNAQFRVEGRSAS